MSLPSPNLDDRTWRDISEDAKKMIPGFCPQWTDFNPSDPGIALVELMAWMMEMTLYRLNRVPDKNYIKFMELLGIRLNPPVPASAWLLFETVDGADADQFKPVPQNTRVAGDDLEGNSIIFETTEPMNLNHAKLTAVFARINEQFKDSTVEMLSRETSLPVQLFDVSGQVPHTLYLCDPDLDKASLDFNFCIQVDVDKPIPPLDTRWSYWDGEEWRPAAPEKDETVGFSKNGTIVFTEMEGIKPREIQGHMGFWLKVDLSPYRGGAVPSFAGFKKVMEIKRKAGIFPDTGFYSTEDVPYLPASFESYVLPFGKTCQKGNALYIGSQVFRQKGEPVRMDIQLAPTYKPSPITELIEVRVGWEYYAESGEWRPLGTSAAQGTLDSAWSFVDHTEAFTKSGKVTFTVPDDMAPLEMWGQVQHWIRLTMRAGSYGEEKKLNPPVLDQFLLHYTDTPHDFTRYITNNDFIYQDRTEAIHSRKPRLFTPFEPVGLPQPELFLGFDKPFTNKIHSIYFLLEGKYETGTSLTWEYYGPDGWKTLSLAEDETLNFSSRGRVKLMGPPDWTLHPQFGQEAYWLKIRWIRKTPETLPAMRNIFLNIVKAINAVSYKDEILGSSNGQPFQQFTFLHNETPILPGPRILVRELESSIQKEIEDYKSSVKQNTFEEKDPDTGEVKALWVEWEQRENFFQCKWDSRYFMLDEYKGTVTFGDGIKGMIPFNGSKIKCLIYYTGGGSHGNMGQETISKLDLEEPIPFVQQVSNPYPAGGGQDMESLEDAKLRVPWELKHRHRAVTKEDFEFFARQSTTEVARVDVRTTEEGIIDIMIVPHGHQGDQSKPQANSELLRRVKEYVSEHALITTRIDVFGPSYTDFWLMAEVVLLPQMSHMTQQIRMKIVESIKAFFHPLTGDMKGGGWQMGRPVHISELYFIIENTGGVDYVESLILNGEPLSKKIKIPPRHFPYPKEIDISFIGE